MNVESESLKLYLTADQELLHEIQQGFESLHNPLATVNAHVMYASLAPEDLQNIVWLICARIPQSRWESVRCCTIPGTTPPTPELWMRSESLEILRKQVDAVWLREIIKEGRLVTFFQPIISNRKPYHVFAYECLIRGLSRDQELIAPWKLFTAARGSGLMSRLDHAARLKSIETAKNLAIGVNIFINFNPRFISDSLADLAETMEAVRESGVAPHRFVFEVVESEEIHDVGKLHEIIDYCRKTGCKVALDDVGAGYNSLNNLPEVRPDFIKLDMELVKDVQTDHYKSRVASKLLELARELEVNSIMEGIETSESWKWVRQNGADFSQGYLFAKPAAVPPSPLICPHSFTITGAAPPLPVP
ncbi:MAG: EAL domain-containing protein [Planctomycetota bacterium]|nr:EAL domain-containing protein [Planctomycetota bacterium]